MGLLTKIYQAGGTKRYNSRDLYDVFQTLQQYGEPRSFKDLFGMGFIDAIAQGTIDLEPEHRLHVMWSILIRDYARRGGVKQKDQNFCNDFIINKGTPIPILPEATPNS